jgi:hypothetical protein
VCIRGNVDLHVLGPPCWQSCPCLGLYVDNCLMAFVVYWPSITAYLLGVYQHEGLLFGAHFDRVFPTIFSQDERLGIL